jgi:hypothetical protein
MQKNVEKNKFFLPFSSQLCDCGVTENEMYYLKYRFIEHICMYVLENFRFF